MDDDYGTPIMYSIIKEKWEIFLFLLDSGADLGRAYLHDVEDAIYLAAISPDPRYLDEMSNRGLTSYCYCMIALAERNGESDVCERLMDAHTRSEEYKRNKKRRNKIGRK